jgi:uncharacterized protein (DUF2336 family)
MELAAFLADPATPEVERRAVVPAVLKLAGFPDEGLRRELAARLSQASALHADIVFTLAAAEDEIALPFLAATRALDAWRMLAILQVGDTARRIMLANRRDIHPEAVAAIAGARLPRLRRGPSRQPGLPPAAVRLPPHV